MEAGLDTVADVGRAGRGAWSSGKSHLASVNKHSISALASSYGLVVVVPVLYFLLMGIVYLLSRYIGGQGTFLEQCNTSLSIQFPLGILSKLLALIPGIGRILNIVLSLYGIVLQVVVIMAVHRLGKGKAIASVFIPLVAIGALAGAVFLLMKR